MIQETEALELRGVQVVPVYYRYGPQALARHVIGNLGKVSEEEYLYRSQEREAKSYRLDDLVGKQGLEAIYEKELKGAMPEKTLKAFVDAGGQLVPGLGYELLLDGLDPQRQDVVLTIDYRVQKIVEEIMDKSIQAGAVVVMDARNGDLLALASRPNYDQNYVGRYLPRKDKALLDHTTLLYQPGSVFKVVVAAAALEERIVTPRTLFTCLGDKDNIISYNGAEGHETLTFTQAMAFSCNSTFARVGLKLGPDLLIEYAAKLGLNNQEIAGYQNKEDQRQDWNKLYKPYSLVNSSIGQGDVLATPVQITAMMNVVASKGYYWQPRLVKELRASSGKTVKNIATHPPRRVISASTAKELHVMLAGVTREGTGKAGYVPWFGSAGKTGTAQVNKSKGITNAWFSGYAPLEEPRYVVTVLVEEGNSGGQTAAPVFKKIMDELLKI